MLWRRLRASRAARSRDDGGAEEAEFSFLRIDSSEESSSDSWRSHSDDDDAEEGTAGCTPS